MGVLLRAGVEVDDPCIQNAVKTLVTPEIAGQHKNHFTAGDALDADGCIMFRKPKEFGGSYMGPFNYGWHSLNPIESQDLQRMVNDPKNRFRFGFYIKDLAGHPIWALQTLQPYEFFAEMLEKNTLMDNMTDKSLTGFKYLWGIEPNWRNKVSIKCDLTYRILNTCWRVLA